MYNEEKSLKTLNAFDLKMFFALMKKSILAATRNSTLLQAKMKMITNYVDIDFAT